MELFQPAYFYVVLLPRPGPQRTHPCNQQQIRFQHVQTGRHLKEVKHLNDVRSDGAQLERYMTTNFRENSVEVLR